MSEIEISSGLEDSEPDIFYNMDVFQQMINLCRNNKQFPQKYVEDMNKMYNKCSNKQKNSKHLCSLVLKGLELISPKNKNSFQYAADVYNALLQLSKKDSNSLQTENCVASTSNGNASMTSELENNISNNEISESHKIFKELIEKCYQNKHFSNLNVEKIDKLYNSLPSEFLNSNYFIKLLREANKIIWPDSGITLFIHLEHIYDQLQQFKASMQVQDTKTSRNNKEIDGKKLKQLKKLKTALKIVRKKIKILDEQEMDINNEDEFNADSAYILKDKYEKRIVEIYKRMCKLSDEPNFLEEPILRFRATNNKLINKTIEKYYNLNKTFPDYYEVYTLLKCLRDKKKLDWTETELKNISHDAFLKLGKQLKLQRLNEYFGRLASVNVDKDPAEEDEDLRKKLDESNKKLHADLNMLTKKFENKQDYAEETEGSNLNDTECENSSENEYTDNNRKLYKEPKPISVRRKRRVSLSSSSESENFKRPIKSQKTLYMESFDLMPSGVNSETIQEEANDKINVIKKKVPDKITVKDIDDIINKKNSIGIVKDADKLPKKVSKNVLRKVVKADETLESNNLVTDIDTDADGILVIDEEVRVENNTKGKVIEEPLENNIKEIESELNAMHHSSTSIDNEDQHQAERFEPEVIIEEINEDKDSSKDVIEINELDDSDVEITSCETPIVPVHNKKSLDSIIKSCKLNYTILM
uniref:Death domain-associated protein 6 n=1 Tax=Melanaphis sacchari TaxID=742174 RepID=A0A2H8TMX4_9HEMI